MGCTGCQIDWKKGKNVTLKTIKKKQKHKGRGTVRTVTKTVSNDSFFNFFAPPEVPESGDLDDDSEAILAADFEIGHFLRERIIPRSVLYFTGEAIEDDDDDYDEEGDEADEIIDFLAMLALHCCMALSPVVASVGYSLVAVYGLLTAVDSLAVEHRL
ncbi:hypothetical protein MG293_000917 [Ovis ammon polii]|uniref:Nucleosome assembly protein 1-like 1 n=1 Tax=Ovis ammon polii TaxID=230172 RepID=A0AAD4UPG8_OVIAM|nr:hypothetical protein MG293_000917 [Ovis ammon polii]